MTDQPQKPRRRWFQFSLCALLIVVTLVAGLLVAWRAYVEPTYPDYSKKALNIKEALKEEFANAPSISFRSYDGQWIGMDCDIEIELKPNGTVVLTWYSNAKTVYDGTYSIQGLELSLSFKNYNAGSWPSMYFLRDGPTLQLVPTPNTIRYHSGQEWPYRQIPLDISVWSECPFDLPKQLPDADTWARDGSAWEFEGDGWHVLVFTADDRPDESVPELLPNAKYVAYVTLEPIGAPNAGYEMLERTTRSLAHAVDGLWIDPNGNAHPHDEGDF